MIKSIWFLFFCFTTFFANSQDFSSQFKKLQEKRDTSEQIKLLKNWEAANSKDPEMFIAYFNYYANKSMTEVISIDKKSISPKRNFKADVLKKGFEYIDKGLLLYPTRLDMRFGKIYMLGKVENFTEFTNYLVSTIDYGNSIKDAWTWKEGKTLEDAKNFFLNSMQDYVTTIYNTEDDNLLPLMRQISETVLKYNPAHVVSLSNVALTYLVTENYDKALESLLKAEKIAPKDVIVLNNIAQTYKREKDKPNAKTYLEKIVKVGNKDEIDDASQQLRELTK